MNLQSVYFEHLDYPWYKVNFRVFDGDLQEACKAVPGFTWAPIGPLHLRGEKSWIAPIDALPAVKDICEWNHAYVSPIPQCPFFESYISDGDRPYQIDAVQRTRREGSSLIAFEQGLGKTRAAIRLLEPRSLVICPSNVKREWVDQLRVLRPELSVGVIQTADDWLDMATWTDITICSWQLSVKLSQDARYRTVVLDESHYIANGRSKRSLSLRQHLSRYRPMILALTGTPVQDRIEDLWHQVDTCFPWRFGTWPRFVDRYALWSAAYTTEDGETKGKKVHGVNPLYAEELKTRLSYFMTRATKAEWSHLLPPLTITPVWVDASANLTQVAADLATEMCETVDRVACLTWTHEAADALAKALDVPAIYGGTVEQRRPKLEARAQSKGPSVFGIGSIMEGINCLTPFTDVILVEAPNYPLPLSQGLARFHRSGSPRPVTIRILVRQGTEDEQVFALLAQKITDINKVISSGATENAVENLVQSVSIDDSLLGGLEDEV